VASKPTNNPAATMPIWWPRADGSLGIRSLHLRGCDSLISRAVKLDPNFALAWAYLSYRQSDYYGRIRSESSAAGRSQGCPRSWLRAESKPPETILLLVITAITGSAISPRLAEFQQAEQGLPNNVDVNERSA